MKTKINIKYYFIYILTLYIFLINGNLLSEEQWEDLISSANYLIKQKNYDSALACLNRATEIAAKTSPIKYVISFHKKGMLYYSIGNFEKAAESFSTEKNLIQSSFGIKHPSYAVALNNLSSAYQFVGKYAEAEKLLLEAIDLKKLNIGVDDTSYAKSLHNLGKLYQTLGKYSDAENYYNLALTIKNKLGEKHPLIANTLLNLGILYKTLGNFNEAENKIKKAYDIFYSSYGIENPSTSSAGLQLALVYLALKKEKEANEMLSKISKYAKNIDANSPDYTSSMYDLAMLYWNMKKYSDAEDILVTIKPIIEKQQGKTSTLFSSCLNSLGIICWLQGKLEQAYKYLSQVVTLRELFYGENHPDYAVSLFNIAGVLSDMKNYEMAEKNYYEALSLNQNQIKYYFPFLSENEKTLFYSNIKDRFEIFNNYVLLRRNENPDLIGKMFDNNMAIKGIVLNNVLAIRRDIIETKNETLLKKFENWKKIREELAFLYSLSKPDVKKLNKNIDSLENLANLLEKEISKQSMSFKQNLSSSNISWKDIRNSLKSDEAVVEIIRFKLFNKGFQEDVCYVALIITSETKDNPELVIIDNKNELETKFIFNYLNAIQHKLDDVDSYKAFWKNIDEKIKNKKKVYLSLDGIYNKINVLTLQNNQGKYLIEEKDIFLLTNSSEILKMNLDSKKPETKNAYLFGSPKYALDKPIKKEGAEQIYEPSQFYKNFKITPLPGTKAEIENISNIMIKNGWNVNVFEEEKATKQNIKSLIKPNILHIATHGIFLSSSDSKNTKLLFKYDVQNSTDNAMLRSCLLFAGAENFINAKNYNDYGYDNGILTAYEVVNLDLSQTELVVLSACESGLGEIKNGEGVYGLQRAFQSAGAKSLIMSLWNVDDARTQELMTNFYSNWLSGKDKYTAFKNAQLSLLKKYHEPFYWGAFIMIGV